MDTNQLNKEVDLLIMNLEDPIKKITETLRSIILATSPNLMEEFKWSMPNYSYNGLVCYLQMAQKHVNLGFQKGNELVEYDTNHLLQGTGKTMRHIRIKKVEEINREAFTLLIKRAMELNEI